MIDPELMAYVLSAHEKIGGIRGELEMLRAIKGRYDRLGLLVDGYFDERGPKPLTETGDFFLRYRDVHNGYDINPAADVAKKARDELNARVAGADKRVLLAQAERVASGDLSSPTNPLYKNGPVAPDIQHSPIMDSGPVAVPAVAVPVVPTPEPIIIGESAPEPVVVAESKPADVETSPVPAA